MDQEFIGEVENERQLGLGDRRLRVRLNRDVMHLVDDRGFVSVLYGSTDWKATNGTFTPVDGVLPLLSLTFFCLLTVCSV